MNHNHAHFQDQIQAGPRQSAESQAALAEHLAACPECRAYAEHHARFQQVLPQAYPTERHTRLEIHNRAVRVQAALEKRRRARGFFHSTFALAGAGAAVIVLLAVFSLLTQVLSRPPASGGMPAPTEAERQTETSTPAAGTATAGLDSVNGIPAATRAVSAGTASVRLQAGLSAFPTTPGTRWVYLKSGYAPSENDPQTLLRATARVEETIASLQRLDTYTLLHIKGKKALVTADPGWQETGAFGLGDYEYWYILQGDRVYFSAEKPQAGQIDVSKLRLEYPFPFSAGDEWCQTSQRTGTVQNPTPDPQSPCPARRVVKSAEPLQTPLGELKACYALHDVASSGDVIRQFCEGIGIAALRYDHSGTRFGERLELLEFTSGQDGASRVVITPTYAGFLRTPTIAPLPSDSPIPAVASVKAETAYLGIGSRVAAIDIRKPDAPWLLGLSQELPGPVVKTLVLPNGPTPRVVASAGRYLAMLDITVPGDLGLITQSKLPGPVNALIFDIVNNRLYAGGPLNSDKSKGYVVSYDPTPGDTLTLLDTLQLDAPVQGLALVNSTLYIAHNGAQPKVSVLTLQNDKFGAPANLLFSGQPIYSMTVGGDTLYIGSEGRLLAYRVAPTGAGQAAWQVEQVMHIAMPGRVLGLALRGKTIYTAGVTVTGQPFQQAVQPEKVIQAGSVVDAASYITVGYGQMLVAGPQLAIYSILDPQNLSLLGVYPLAR